MSHQCLAAGLWDCLFPGEHHFALQGTHGQGVPGTRQSAEHTQILSPPIYSQIKTEKETSASRLQVPDLSDSESSRRKSREGSLSPAPHGCNAAGRAPAAGRTLLRGAGPVPGTAGDCCWAQNNDFTLLMPRPQTTTVHATQRLIHAPVGFVGCYSVVSCMERCGIRKSFHPDAGSLILQLSRERTE